MYPYGYGRPGPYDPSSSPSPSPPKRLRSSRELAMNNDYLILEPPLFPFPLKIPFPDRKLPVCANCKRNYKTREVCRSRDQHTSLPWKTIYLCIRIHDNCFDEDGNLGELVDMDLEVTYQWEHNYFKFLHPVKPDVPICYACKVKNYTRSYCRERLSHRSLPWDTTYVLIKRKKSSTRQEEQEAEMKLNKKKERRAQKVILSQREQKESLKASPRMERQNTNISSTQRVSDKQQQQDHHQRTPTNLGKTTTRKVDAKSRSDYDHHSKPTSAIQEASDSKKSFSKDVESFDKSARQNKYHDVEDEREDIKTSSSMTNVRHTTTTITSKKSSDRKVPLILPSSSRTKGEVHINKKEGDNLSSPQECKMFSDEKSTRIIGDDHVLPEEAFGETPTSTTSSRTSGTASNQSPETSFSKNAAEKKRIITLKSESLPHQQKMGSSSAGEKVIEKSVESIVEEDSNLLVSSASKTSKDSQDGEEIFFNNVYKSRTFVVTVNGTEMSCNYEVRFFLFTWIFFSNVMMYISNKFPFPPPRPSLAFSLSMGCAFRLVDRYRYGYQAP